MLAEIFMLRLETKAREEAAATPSPRFVPVTLPPLTPRYPARAASPGAGATPKGMGPSLDIVACETL